MPRPAGTGNKSPKPILNFQPPLRKKKLSVEIIASVAELLDKYPLYIKSINGAVPSQDEVVSLALENVFKRDAGFQAYLGNSNGNNNRQSATSGAETSKQ